jgi:hypothetical protein
MPHEKFVFTYETGPLNYLIAIPKALPILMAHKIRDRRFQLLIIKAAFAVFAALAAGLFGVHLVPVFLAVGAAAQGVCVFALLLWFWVGDIFLTFALEDEQFYELATATNALNIFEDPEFSLA